MISPSSKSISPNYRTYNPYVQPPSDVRRKSSSFKKMKRRMEHIGGNGTKQSLFSFVNDNYSEKEMSPNHWKDDAFDFRHLKRNLPTTCQMFLRRSGSGGECGNRSNAYGERSQQSSQELVRSQSWHHTHSVV